MRTHIILSGILLLFLSCSQPGKGTSEARVYIDEYNRLIVAGKPVFPVGLHFAGIGYLSELASCGFNFVWSDVNEVGPTIDFDPPPIPYPYSFDTFLDAARDNGLMGFYGLSYDEVKGLYEGTITWDDLAVTLDKIKDNPALLGYQICDEPESPLDYPQPYLLPPFLSEIESGFRERYPGRPVRIANTNEDVFPLFGSLGDIMELNIYPVFTDPAKTDLYEVARNMDLAREARAGKGPVWACLQAYGNIVSEARTDRWPTAVEIRYMTYLALAHGAQGISYFRFCENPGEGTIQSIELAQAIRNLAGELRDLSPVLLSINSIFDADVGDNPDIECFCKIYNNVTYLFTLNNSDTSQTCNFSFPALSQDVEVLFESETITPEESSFQDSFTAREVHIYAVPDYFTLVDPSKYMPVQTGTTLSLDIHTSCNDVSKADFYIDDTLFGTDTTPSNGFHKTWTPEFPGIYRLKATGTKSDFTTVTSPEVEILVYCGNGRHIWHSYNVNMETKTIEDSEGNTAMVEFYESSDTDGISPGTLFGSFHDTVQPQEYTGTVIPYWTADPGIINPYVGRYTTPRESVPEGQEPVFLPYGVHDIAVHPPWEHLTVIAFEVPEPGNYHILNLGVKKTSDQGGSVTLKVFAPDTSPVTEITANVGAAYEMPPWYYDDTVYYLTGLDTGDCIYFALDCDADIGNDFSVITFTVIKDSD